MSIVAQQGGIFGQTPTTTSRVFLKSVFAQKHHLVRLQMTCAMEDDERKELYSTPTTVFPQVFTQKRVQFSPLVIFHHTWLNYSSQLPTETDF